FVLLYHPPRTDSTPPPLHDALPIWAEGNENVILCERGIRTFETSMRNTLDLAGVVMLHKMTHLPVVVDPSHACGQAWMEPQLAKDRKSTRLNSSHVSISYAVFCLNK